MKTNLEVTIDGVLIAPSEIEKWERQRAKAVLAKLRRMLKIAAPDQHEPNDLAWQRSELVRLKDLMGRDGLRTALAGEMRMSAWMTKLVIRLSGSRRKPCVVEVKVPRCSAQQVSEGIDSLMYDDAPANRHANLAACPDHYLLEPRGMELEVIETTGGSLSPAQFFMRFGDDSGIMTPRDASYPYQSAGTARLADGTTIGGVRHQIRDAEGGAHVRLMVEFPRLTPGFMIRQHQWHLACEFSNWLRGIQREVNPGLSHAGN
ncbi:MAG: hypothetical protein LCH79_17230 [Proteobacteria bacterium]|nr:hypothetical protein [Pseudomonadota bacterium]